MDCLYGTGLRIRDTLLGDKIECGQLLLYIARAKSNPLRLRVSIGWKGRKLGNINCEVCKCLRAHVLNFLRICLDNSLASGTAKTSLHSCRSSCGPSSYVLSGFAPWGYFGFRYHFWCHINFPSSSLLISSAVASCDLTKRSRWNLELHSSLSLSGSSQSLRFFRHLQSMVIHQLLNINLMVWSVFGVTVRQISLVMTTAASAGENISSSSVEEVFKVGKSVQGCILISDLIQERDSIITRILRVH